MPGVQQMPNLFRLLNGIGRHSLSVSTWYLVLTYQFRIKEPSLAAKVDDHQRQILAVIAGALPLLDRPHASTATGIELSKARMEMTRLLMEYALFKHRDIFAPIIAAGGKRTNDCLRLKNACIAAGEEYRDFIRSGNRADPLTDWEAYRVGAFAMARTMSTHLAEERSGIRRLLGVRGAKKDADGVSRPPRDETVNVVYI